MPSRRGERCPVASMSSDWPKDHGIQIPTIGTNALYRSHSRSLDTCAAVVPHVILSDEDLDGT